MSQQIDWLQRLGKWRTVFAGWQLGTRAKGDPECDAVRDHREVTLIMRAELNALAQLLVDRGVFTAQEFSEQVNVEAERSCADLSERFPGITATDYGLTMTAEAAETMRTWKP